MRLSTANIQNATAQKKTVRLFEGRGLYPEIAPIGSRWWRFKYRFAGKEKRISLGVNPDVGLKEARDRRDERAKLVADGIDPSAARKQQKLMALDAAENNVEAVAREWFEKHSANWEASYSVKLLARLEAFAPHSQYRAAVTPAHRGRGAATPRHVAMSLARRLRRVFGVEIECCARCGGELKIIASIEEPQLIAKILSHLERAAPEQSRSELSLRNRGPPRQLSLL